MFFHVRSFLFLLTLLLSCLPFPFHHVSFAHVRDAISSGESVSSPRPKYNLFDDLVTSGLHHIRRHYPEAQPFDVEGSMPQSQRGFSADPSDFRSITINAWDASKRLNISTTNTPVDYRFWDPLKTRSQMANVPCFEWAHRQTTLALAFMALKDAGKLEPIRQVNLQSLYKPEGAQRSRQPFFVLKYGDQTMDDVLVGSWDRHIYSPPPGTRPVQTN